MTDTNLATDTPEPVLNAEPATETAPELPLETPPQPHEPPAPKMIPVSVLERRLRNEQERVREFENRANRAERAAEEARSLAERLQRNGSDANNSLPRHEPPQQIPAEAIRAEAIKLRFQEDASHVSSAGVQAYGGQWNDSLNILQSFDLNTPDFISAIMEVAGREKTHEVVRAITEDPSKAAVLADMSPARRIAEITRISERMSTKPPQLAAAAKPAEPVAAPAKTVSQAPRPAPHVEANTGKTFDWNSKDQDKMSDVEWSKAFNERMHARSPRR